MLVSNTLVDARSSGKYTQLYTVSRNNLIICNTFHELKQLKKY
jgi:hypothetical protein